MSPAPWFAYDAYSAKNRAGIGRYAREVLAALLRAGRGREMAVFTAPGASSEAFRALPRSQEAVEWRAPRWASHRLVFEDLWLPRAFERSGCSVLYNPDFTLPFRFRGRGVVTVHDLSFWDFPASSSLKARLLYGIKVPRSTARARRVLTVSDATTRALLLRRLVQPGRAVCVEPGVSPVFRPQASAARRTVERRFGIACPFVLGVGTLEPRKNWETLGVAMATHPGLRPLSLVLCGGPGRGGARIMEKLGKTLPGRLHFLTGATEEDLVALYGACRAFCYPSLYEGFGLPVVEALACGAPTVTSNVSSLPQAAGGAAWLVDPHDPVALGRALDRLLRDAPLRARLRARGIARARRLTWDATARRVWKESELARQEP